MSKVRWLAATLFCFCWILSSCATPASSSWRTRVLTLVDELDHQEAAKFFPREYKNLLTTFEHGEVALQIRENEEEADAFYLLALQEGYLLKTEVQRAVQQSLEEAQRLAVERERAEQERLSREAAQAQELLQQQKKAAAEAEAASALKEKRLKEASAQTSTSYTVRRGESLPQIAGRTEIYNDSSLWPLLYRANRDQIRDPKRLWPGQVLFIPRNYSREDALEARRYSNRK